MGKAEEVAATAGQIMEAVFPGGQVPQELYALADKMAVLVRSLAQPFEDEAEWDDDGLLIQWNFAQLIAGDERSYIAGEIARACLKAKRERGG